MIFYNIPFRFYATNPQTIRVSRDYLKKNPSNRWVDALTKCATHWNLNNVTVGFLIKMEHPPIIHQLYIFLKFCNALLFYQYIIYIIYLPINQIHFRKGLLNNLDVLILNMEECCEKESIFIKKRTPRLWTNQQHWHIFKIMIWQKIYNQ